MTKKYFPLLFLLMFRGYGFSQTSYQSAEDQPGKFKTYVPKGYFIHTVLEGDLNLDPYNDALMILAQEGEDSLSNTENPLARKVYLLTGKKDGTYRIEAENEAAIYHYRYDWNFPESLAAVSLDKGIFTFSFYGGMRTRWYRDISFHYSTEKKLWYLISDISGTFDALEEDESLETEKRLFEKDFGFVNFTEFDILQIIGHKKACGHQCRLILSIKLSLNPPTPVLLLLP